MPARKYTREVLAPLVAEATSVADVLRVLGLRPNGGSHAHLSRTIRAYGLDTSHFQRYGQQRRAARRSAAEILIARPAGSRREKPRLLTRSLLERGRVHECAGCGIGPSWRGVFLTLDVDHVDGDFLNNRAENLRFLCPNCHRQTPNFAGRSKGSFAGDGADRTREAPA